jgi:hypothetical protein
MKQVEIVLDTLSDVGNATPKTRCNCNCAREPFHRGNDVADVMAVIDDTNDVPHTKHIRHCDRGRTNVIPHAGHAVPAILSFTRPTPTIH